MKEKLALGTLLLGGAISCAQVEKQVPNVVILFVDDLGWADLGYQNKVFHTPHIDQLKSDGLYFSRAYVSTATSSPSRASLMTGKEALRVGFVRHIYEKDEKTEFRMLDSDPGKMKSRGWLPLEETTYAERLKEYGYYNYFVGKWHLGHEPYFPIHQGFDAMYGTGEHGHPKSFYAPFFMKGNPLPQAKKGTYLTDMLTDNAEEFILKYDKKQPFLLNMWYYNVHSPFIGRKDLVEKYEKEGLTGTDAVYAAMVTSMDESVGRIRAALKKKGVADNTVIIFSSDQGGFFQNAHLRGGKRGGETLCEGGSRVPLIIYYPGKPAMKQTYSEPVQTLDIYPTLVQIASGGKPCADKQIQGVSLLPTFEGEKLKERDLFLYRSYEDQNAAMLRGDWKLIKFRSGKYELYNLKQDESETTNLFSKETTIGNSMKEELTRWEKEATPSYMY